MCMTGFSSWRFWFKSGLKGEGEAVEVFINFPKCFSWAPYSLSSETHKGRDELFPSCIWQMLLIYIQSLQRQSTHCHDFLYNLDANPFPRLQVYYYQISCAHSGLNILWSLKMSKIHCRWDRLHEFSVRKLGCHAVLVISCCITNDLTASVGQEPGCSSASSGSLTSVGKVLARTVSSQDSVGRSCFQAHSCACWRPRVLTGCWPEMIISFPWGLFHRGTHNMAVGFPQSEISEREGWGRGEKD